MFIQEMDYLMERYWYPHIPNRRIDPDEGMKGHVDFSEVDHPKEKQQKHIDPEHDDYSNQ